MVYHPNQPRRQQQQRHFPSTPSPRGGAMIQQQQLQQQQQQTQQRSSTSTASTHEIGSRDSLFAPCLHAPVDPYNISASTTTATNPTFQLPPHNPALGRRASAPPLPAISLTPSPDPSGSARPPSRSSTNTPQAKRRRMSSNASTNIQDGGVDPRITGNSWFPDIPRILPHEKVFPIQIGNKLFRLSGASISSDAPSYFSQFFERQLATCEEGQPIRTLYIDRDPETFNDIARHLQGYHISPRNGPHFVRLFADAQFYSLPKLISQLFESEIFISIGSQHFQINRDLFQAPGNSPNYFTLGFAVFFSNPSEIFPGLNRDGLLRPPSILPPEVPNRSAEVFAELLHLLRGYPVQIRDEGHRQQLLRDCRYFHFKGLEQKLIPHEISWNPTRMKSEIVIKLEDIKPSGISFVPDNPASESRSGEPMYVPGWVNYARPFVGDHPRELIVEISGESTRIDWRQSRAEFTGVTNQRVSALLQVITNKLGLPISHEYPMGLKMINERINGAPSTSGPTSPGNTPLSDDKVKIRIGSECYLSLDGEEVWDRDGIPMIDIEPPDDVSSTGDPYAGVTRPGPGSDAGLSAGRGSSPGIPWQNAPLSRPASTKPHNLGPLPYPAQVRKRLKRKASMDESNEWTMKRAQWRLRIQPVQGADGKPASLEAIFVGVKLEAFSGEYGRNSKRAFLV